MSTYIYRRAASTGATQLAEAGGFNRYRAINLPMERKVRNGDAVVCWGETFQGPVDGVRVLNGARIQDKLADALALKARGVPTIVVETAKPQPAPPIPAGPDPAFAAWEKASEIAESFVNMDAANPVSRGPVMRAAVADLYKSVYTLHEALGRPAPVATPGVDVGVWLGRMRNHVGGNDLFTPPVTPDFYVKKENIVREFRVHSFCGKSIRAGVKEAAEGAGINLHPWIRSYDGGWRIKYDGVTVTQRHRDIAHAAVKALGLDFGAVDIAELADGRLIVLECNRAPGLDGGTITKYAEAIQRWLNGETGQEV